MFKYDSVTYESNKPGEAEITLCESPLAKEILNWTPHKNLLDYINTQV